MGMPGPFTPSNLRDQFSDEREGPKPIKATARKRPTRRGTPDWTNFTIEKIEQINRFAVVLIHYSDCTIFKGRKLLVYEYKNVYKIKRWKRIDPHLRNSIRSPVACFQPTQDGWSSAIAFCRNEVRRWA